MTLFILISGFLFSSVFFVESQYVYDTKYVDVNVDHFNLLNTDTFKLRYLENNSYWNARAGDPIFFHTGGEADINDFAQNTGLMWEMAPKFNALLIFAEHRYYGESIPYGNKSLTNLKYWQYLSSFQALADFVDVLRYVKSSYNVNKNNNPVILFGGSYGGMLAAWFRMKYPDESVGALASSAPIWLFQGLTPCEAFNDIVSFVFAKTSPTCYKSIKKSWDVIDNLTSNPGGMQWISDNFKLCNPLTNQSDVNNLKDWLISIWGNLAMLNYPYANNLMYEMPANPVKVACNQFANGVKDNQDLLMEIALASGVFFNTSGQVKCLAVDNANGDYGNVWLRQTCTEQVMPMCSSTNSMFQPKDWDLKAFSDNCYSQYSVRPQPFLVEKMYGGKDIQHSSNIIFSNGLMDPWSSGGVLSTISKTVVAVIIPHSAHHLDLRESNPADPPSIRRARAFYRKTFKRWIKKHRSQRNTTSIS